MKTPRHHRGQRGIALVLALASVVLICALVLAFLSRSMLNRQIAFSSSNLIKTDVLDRSAAELITSEIRNEIIDPAHSNLLTGGGSYTALYQPKTTADAVPRQLGVSSATGPIVRVSGNNVPIQPNGTITGSSVSISTPSLNGRYISSSRWFTSTTASPQLGSQSTLPTWLFVTRNDGILTPTLLNAKDPTNNDYVMGRFAYTVYDIGGLLNANFAGSPTVAAADAAYKSTGASADLTAIGFSSTAATNLTSWRNVATGVDAATFREWATGVARTSGTPNAAALAAATAGHLSAATGDNMVLSRHDLLQNPVFASGVSSLTHFSRSVNAPTYSPATPTTINPNLADVRWPSAGTITHYQDNGTATTYAVQAGDPFLQHRFSLAKLAWLTYKGPSADLPTTDPLYNAGGTDANISSCFGLTWNTTSSLWNYSAEDTTSFTIKSLSAVAAEGREPNFFETLRAGIADGSIGQQSQQLTQNNYQDELTREGNSDLQILRIGANIIDCADTDNFPTTITLNVGGVAIPVYGQEDLPNLFRLLITQVSQVEYISAASAQLDWATFFMLPQLFNPNRSGISNSASPSNIRINIYSGTVNKVYNVRASLTNPAAPLARWNLSNDLTQDPPIVVPSTSYETFRSAVKTPTGTDATSPTTLGTLVTSPASVDSSISSQHAFIYYVYTGLPETYSNSVAPPQINFRSFVNSLVITLDYQDSANAWHTYDTLGGSTAFAASGSGIGNDVLTGPLLEFKPTTTTPGSGTQTNSNPNFAPNLTPQSYHGLTKIDPRTTRFGLPDGAGFGSNYNTYNSSTVGSKRGLTNYLPFGSGTGTSLFPELWPQGNKTNWSDTSLSTTTNINDKDGVVRPADEWYNSTGNLFNNLTVTNGTNRPVILQRPFRSVAELGYVFRDSPWKTLSFFDDTSGDAALLDLFAVADEPTVGQGRVNLNATSTLIPQSLFSGAAQASDGTSPLSSPAALAAALNAYAFSAGVPTATMPLNVAQLPTFMTSSNLTGAYSTSSVPDKGPRESIVRALAGSTQTRTWNLLIDVVAQTGRYPTSANSLNDFLVDGEKRYWLFVAIDRYTGKIVDQKLEPVDE